MGRLSHSGHLRRSADELALIAATVALLAVLLLATALNAVRGGPGDPGGMNDCVNRRLDMNPDLTADEYRTVLTNCQMENQP